MPPQPQRYRDVVGRNIAAERARSRLSHTALAARMTAIGFGWARQTVTAAERPGGRRVTVEEIAGLAAVLGVPLDALLLPAPGTATSAALPGGHLVVFGDPGQPLTAR